MSAEQQERAARQYYDDFAADYENRRGYGYHQMLDDLEFSLVERYVRIFESAGGRSVDILEVGCGTGLLLQRAERFVGRATGIDVSAEMLARARERGLSVTQGTATALPYADASFDLGYCFKVLPHVVGIRTAMAELARVVRPGGYILAEFYNRQSLRYLIKRLKPPSAISATRTDADVYTRYDDLASITSYLPPELRVVGIRGVRIVTPTSYAHDIPGVGPMLRALESVLADTPGVRRLGGFLVIIARKR